MWQTDDYEGNGNAGGNSDGYEGGWEGTSAAYWPARKLANCTLCGEPMPGSELNSAGECTECTDAAEGACGF